MLIAVTVTAKFKWSIDVEWIMVHCLSLAGEYVLILIAFLSPFLVVDSVCLGYFHTLLCDILGLFWLGLGQFLSW